MEAFTKSVSVDIKAADAADEVEDEDEADIAARDEAFVTHEMRERVQLLREKRDGAAAATAAAASGEGGAAANAAAAEAREEAGEEDDDDDDDDDDALACLDWRAKRF